MECDSFLKFRSLNLIFEFLEHPFLQIGGNHPAGSTHHVSQVDRKKARAATDIEDRHPFFNIGSQDFPRVL
jgi:hypothetical protein